MRTRNPFTLLLEDAGDEEDARRGEVATVPGFWRAVLAALWTCSQPWARPVSPSWRPSVSLFFLRLPFSHPGVQQAKIDLKARMV